MRSAFFALALLPMAIVCPASAQDRTFGDFECTDDCSGHSAGFKWAEKKGITTEADCPYANNSLSFQEGCQAYTRNPALDPDSDDDGNATGEDAPSREMDSDDN
jgi:hypothetical protein